MKTMQISLADFLKSDPVNTVFASKINYYGLKSTWPLIKSVI